MKKSPKGDGERIDTGRRRAFRGLLANFLVSVDEAKGHKHCSLDNLAKLDDRKLGNLVPVMNREFDIDIAGSSVAAVNSKTGQRHVLFDLSNDRSAVFNRVNGDNTIARIAEFVSAELQWDRPKAFEFAKGFVLELVGLNICSFTNPVDDD